WVSTPSLPRDQRVRSRSCHAASETTQPTALSSAGRGQFLSANPAFWAGAAIEAGSRATACACLRRYVFRESRMSGNLLVRFDEGRVGPPEKVSPSLLLYRDHLPARSRFVMPSLISATWKLISKPSRLSP